MRLGDLDIWAVCWMLAAMAVAVAVAAGSARAETEPPRLNLTNLGTQDAEARRIAVTLTPGIRSARDLRSRALIDTRRRLARDQPVTTDALRALADAGDGNAALRLTKRLVDEGRVVRPENMAHYYGIAAATGRVGGLFGLVRVLDEVDPDRTSAARLRLLRSIVVSYAEAGNSVALEALLRFHETGRPFGALDAEIAGLAQNGRGSGPAVMALQMASDLMLSGWDDVDALVEAQDWLTTASEATSIPVKLIAANMRPVVEARVAVLDPSRVPQQTVAPAPIQGPGHGCGALETNPDLATIEGQDGVFYRMLSDVRMERPFSDRTVAEVAALSRALATRGTTLVFAPIPTKSVSMPDTLPERVHRMGFALDTATQVQRDILDRLEAAGVVTVDLRAALIEAEPGQETFFGTDTHWNAHGADLGARAVADVLRAQPVYETLPKTHHQTVETGPERAFSGMRRILQERCVDHVPEPITMTYETTVAQSGGSLDIGLGDGALDIGLGDGALDIGLDDAPLDIGLDAAPLDIGLEAAPLDIGLDAEPLDIGLGDGGEDAALDIGLGGGALDIGLGDDGPADPLDAADRLPVALVGTSFSDLAVVNFPGFLAQHSDLEVVNYAITGGGQYGAITSYLTSEDFQSAPPAFLVWETPIYTNLAQVGDQPLRELTAAAEGRCSQPVPMRVGDDGRTMIGTLGPDFGPRDTLFLNTANPALGQVAFHFWSDDNRQRTRTIRRAARERRNGRFYMPLTGLWPEGAAEVEIIASASFGTAPTLFACTSTPS